jgi:hypothetical protein
MSQKRNKIIVLLFLFIIICIVGLVILRNKHSKNNQNSEVGNIKIFVAGESHDALFQEEILNLPNIPLTLLDNKTDNKLLEGLTNEKGFYEFKQIPKNNTYLIRVNDNNSDQFVSYYEPYIYKVDFPYAKDFLSLNFVLKLNNAALRDLQRQQSLYLYQSLLEDYKKDHGHYPVGQGYEKILNTDSRLISLLKPYLIKRKMDAKNLVDPLSGRAFVYRSGGLHYWLNAYPEIVINIPLFNTKENSYLIYK